jgi:hypothetical protein
LHDQAILKAASDPVLRAKLQLLGTALLRRGFLRQNPAHSMTRIVADGVGRWLDSLVGPLSVLELHAHQATSVSELLGMDGSLDGDFGPYAQDFATALGLESSNPAHLVLGLTASSRSDIAVRQSVERLESACPGLGWSAWWTAEQAGQSWGVVGFNWAKDWASHFYWGGAEDESGYEEMTGEPESECGVLRSEFDAAFPLGQHASQPLPAGVLRALSTHADALVRDTASALLDLRRTATVPCPASGFSGAVFHATEGYWGHAVSTLLVWESFDLAYRIGDDWQEYGDSGYQGPLDWYAAVGLQLDISGDCPLRRAERFWKVPLRRLGALDRLLACLAAREGTCG